MDKDREFKAETDRVEARLLAKAESRISRVAVGETMKVRMGKNSTISGRIESATVAGVTWGGQTCHALFAVVLVCGTSEIRRTVTVKSVPTFRS